MTDEDASGTSSSVIASWVPGTVLTFINAATGDVVSTFTISENIAFGHNTDANDMSDEARSTLLEIWGELPISTSWT